MSRKDKMLRRNERGFSLMELIVVMFILGVLLGLTALKAREWFVNSQIERQTSDLYADLLGARAKAMQRNRTFFVTLASFQYAIYEDTNPAPDGDVTLQTALDGRVVQRQVRYQLVSGGTSTFSFAASGQASADVMIRAYLTAAKPAADCIQVSATRIARGKWNDPNCELQ